jgi:hypothetical protein
MNPLIFFSLLCPDTAYFNEPITVKIEQSEPAPPGEPLPNAWEARSGESGVILEGRIPSALDSFTVRIEGPNWQLKDGAKVSYAIGTLNLSTGVLKPRPEAWCITVMKSQPVFLARPKANTLPVRMGWHGFRLDGRVF